MPEKEVQQNEAGAGIDFGTLELEVNKEIDSLFVPKAQRPEGSKPEVETPDSSRFNIEVRQNEAGAGIDFRALELEVDKEIDSLFIPKAQRPEGSKPEVEPLDFSRYDPDLKKSKSAGEPGAGIDFKALEKEIDIEIDSLLVPAAKSDRNEPPVQTLNQEQPQTIQSKSLASDAQSDPVAQKQGGPSPEPFEAATLPAEYNEAPPCDTFDSEKYQLRELSRLIEMFNAAYLSLDWEFSRENIQKFLAAVNQLEPYASRSLEARSVLRMLDAILKRLLVRPHAVNSMLVQLIRDSQGLLAHMLLTQGEMGPHEKQRLKDLLERFQELRRRALEVKTGAQRPKIGEVPPGAIPPAPCDMPQPLCEDLPAPCLEPRPTSEAPHATILSTTLQSAFQELHDLKDKICRSLSENLEIVDTELARLRQLETTLRRTPALVHVAERLKGIRSSLRDQADILRDTRGEIQAQRAKRSEPVAENGAAREKTGTLVRRENLCLIGLYGKCLAVPASCVLKVARSPAKKGFKILKRGYATLADFRHSFWRVKSGVLGEWTKLPAKELKSYRFEPMEPHSPDQVVTGGPLAVLASDGQTHSIIFAEIVNFIADAEIDTGPSTEWALGPFESKSHLLVPVFDPRSSLSIPGMAAGPQVSVATQTFDGDNSPLEQRIESD